MSIKVLDHVHSVTTFGPMDHLKPSARPVPSSIRVLLARAGIVALPGSHIPINMIDKVLAGRPVSERMRVKSDLRSADLID
jgi:hypothetical protein